MRASEPRQVRAAQAIANEKRIALDELRERVIGGDDSVRPEDLVKAEGELSMAVLKIEAARREAAAPAIEAEAARQRVAEAAYERRRRTNEAEARRTRLEGLRATLLEGDSERRARHVAAIREQIQARTCGLDLTDVAVVEILQEAGVLSASGCLGSTSMATTIRPFQSDDPGSVLPESVL